MTQADKADLEKRFELLADKTEKLEQNIIALNLGIDRLEKKLDDILSAFADSQTSINDVSATISEVENNLSAFNQAECRILKEMDTKLLQQLKSQFDEIHYLQYNLQRTQQATENIEHSCSKELELLNNCLTKDDLKVVESFLRLIAANQMILQTYIDD